MCAIHVLEPSDASALLAIVEARTMWLDGHEREGLALLR